MKKKKVLMQCVANFKIIIIITNKYRKKSAIMQVLQKISTKSIRLSLSFLKPTLLLHVMYTEIQNLIDNFFSDSLSFLFFNAINYVDWKNRAPLASEAAVITSAAI